MINRKRSFRLFGLIVFASGLWWLSEILSPPITHIVVEAKKQSYDFRLTNLDTNQFDSSGSLVYTLKAHTLTHFPEKKASYLKNPTLIQFATNGRSIETRSSSALLADNSKTVVMNGNVVTIQKSSAGKIQTRANSDQLTIRLQPE